MYGLLLATVSVAPRRAAIYKDASSWQDHRDVERRMDRVQRGAAVLRDDKSVSRHLTDRSYSRKHHRALPIPAKTYSAEDRSCRGSSTGLLLPLLVMMSLAQTVDGESVTLRPTCGGIVVKSSAAVCGLPGGEHCTVMTPGDMAAVECCRRVCRGEVPASAPLPPPPSPPPPVPMPPPPPPPAFPPPPPPAFPPPPPPPSCSDSSPPVNMICADGSIYAGKHAAGGKIFVMNADAPTVMSWNGNYGIWVDLPIPMYNCPTMPLLAGGCHDGKGYTTYLASLTGVPGPYVAAKYCNDLVALGKSDWYLPSFYECTVVYQGLGPAPSRGLKNAWYWSSSEGSSYGGCTYNFGNGGYSTDSYKSAGLNVRCIRSEP